jgi:xylulokinase
VTYLIGIDVGTTSVKAGLFDPASGACLSVARQEYALLTPAADRAELDAEIYWQACVATVRQVLAASGVDPRQVAALGVSSQGETLICLDGQGKPLRPAIVWLDNRATQQAERLAGQFSVQAYERTGIPEIVATWPACKILWLRENEPAVFSQTHTFALVQDFLVYRLTGRLTTNASIACTTLYYDFLSHAWWDPVLEAIGIVRPQLPELTQPGEIVGRLAPAAAELLGLPKSVRVAGCGMDQCVGAIGAGNIVPGGCSETTGGALTLQVSVPDPGIDPNKVVPVYAHSLPGQYLFVPVCPTAGMALKWFRDAFAQNEIDQGDRSGADPYDLLTGMARAVPAGSEGLVMLPHLMGAFSPVANTAARGSFTGFTLTHTRGHFVRAVLEGVAYLLRRNLDGIRAAGLQIHEVRVTGGGSRSALWNQIKADVCDLPVLTLATEDTALLGDAILAGMACGAFSSLEQGCQAMVSVKDRYLPGENVAAYRAAYENYCDLDQTLDGYYRRVGGGR